MTECDLGKRWYFVSKKNAHCYHCPTWEGSLGLRLPTWEGSGYLTTLRCGERRTSAAVTKDRGPRGPNLVNEFCTPWTPPVNPSLQSSGPSLGFCQITETSLGATDPDWLRGGLGNISTRVQPLLPSSGICKMATFPERIWGKRG